VSTVTVEQISELNAEFETLAPQDILKWAVGEFGLGLVSVTSFQPTGIVALHMLRDIAPETPVLTLDTDLLFPDTYNLMDELEERFSLRLTRLRPALTLEQQEQQHGEALWERDPNLCCAIRKTAPLDAVLSQYPAWITGLRRDQSEGRGQTPIISWDRKHNNIKLAPLATWTESMVWTYIHAYELPYNALHDRNYPSIGCYPCTAQMSATGEKRSGRWTGHNKTECGIHVQSN
jgi:phosphoadenosine phosphosulfate reductase